MDHWFVYGYDVYKELVRRIVLYGSLVRSLAICGSFLTEFVHWIRSLLSLFTGSLSAYM